MRGNEPIPALFLPRQLALPSAQPGSGSENSEEFVSSAERLHIFYTRKCFFFPEGKAIYRAGCLPKPGTKGMLTAKPPLVGW